MRKAFTLIELSFFGKNGYECDREGLAILPTEPGKGWFVSCDQITGGAKLRLYSRTGEHGFNEIKVVETVSDETDGIEITTRPLGPEFPKGILIMMNSKAKNFAIYDLASVKL